MTSLYWLIGYIVILNIVTLTFYIRIMKWKQRGVTQLNAAPWQKWVFGVGVFLDVALNYTALTVTMLQFPRRGEILATSRFKRTAPQTGWRAVEARGYCWLLNKFDAGHCD